MNPTVWLVLTFLTIPEFPWWRFGFSDDTPIQTQHYIAQVMDQEVCQDIANILNQHYKGKGTYTCETSREK